MPRCRVPYTEAIPTTITRPSRCSSPIITVLKKLGTTLGLTLGLVVAVADPALAHNEFVSSTPADGSSVTVSPNVWEVTFAKEVPLESASGDIIGPDGNITQLATPTHGASTTVLRFTLPPDLAGIQTARWRLESVDGHVISGRVTFAVGETLDSSTVLAESTNAVFSDSTSPAPGLVRWALRLIGFVALLGLGGLLVSEIYIVDGVFAALRDKVALKILAGALVAVPFLLMLIFLGDVFGTSIIGALGHVFDIFDTTPGSVLLVRTLLGGVLAYQLLVVMRDRPSFKDQRLLLAVSGLYTFTVAYGGHSRSRSVPWLGIPVDVVHLVAASVWLGALAIVVFFVAPLVEPKDLWRSFDRYGKVARLAVIALIVTGLIQTLRLHGGITTLFSQNHGRLLLLKLVAVAVMFRLGDVNRRRMTTRIKDNPNVLDKRLREVTKLATAEIATGGVVLAITAALVTASFS